MHVVAFTSCDLCVMYVCACMCLSVVHYGACASVCGGGAGWRGGHIIDYCVCLV